MGWRMAARKPAFCSQATFGPRRAYLVGDSDERSLMDGEQPVDVHEELLTVKGRHLLHTAVLLAAASRTARTCSRRPSSGYSRGGGRYAASSANSTAGRPRWHTATSRENVMSGDFEQRLRAEMEQVAVRPRPDLVNAAYRGMLRAVAATGTAARHPLVSLHRRRRLVAEPRSWSGRHER
jgi:hypothetical protein